MHAAATAARPPPRRTSTPPRPAPKPEPEEAPAEPAVEWLTPTPLTPPAHEREAMMPREACRVGLPTAEEPLPPSPPPVPDEAAPPVPPPPPQQPAPLPPLPPPPPPPQQEEAEEVEETRQTLKRRERKIVREARQRPPPPARSRPHPVTAGHGRLRDWSAPAPPAAPSRRTRPAATKPAVPLPPPPATSTKLSQAYTSAGHSLQPVAAADTPELRSGASAPNAASVPTLRLGVDRGSRGPLR